MIIMASDDDGYDDDDDDDGYDEDSCAASWVPLSAFRAVKTSSVGGQAFLIC